MAKRQDEKPKRRSSLEFTGALRVHMVEPGPVLSAPYWSYTRKKPCEPHAKGRNRCWKDTSRSDEHELEKYTQAACKKVKGIFEQASQRAMDAGRVELDFISEAQAKKHGLRSGPILRLCHAANAPGALMPVTSPLVAKDRASAFKMCISRKVPSIARECSGEVAGPDAPLGGLRRGGGLLSGLFSRR